MGINLNFWSFVLSLGCILLFFLSGTMKDFFVTQLHFHPLTLTLLLSIACFYLSFVGMKDVKKISNLATRDHNNVDHTYPNNQYLLHFIFW